MSLPKYVVSIQDIADRLRVLADNLEGAACDREYREVNEEIDGISALLHNYFPAENEET